MRNKIATIAAVCSLFLSFVVVPPALIGQPVPPPGEEEGAVPPPPPPAGEAPLFAGQPEGAEPPPPPPGEGPALFGQPDLEQIKTTVDETIQRFLPGQVQILTGQRVTDRISGRLLEDVYYDTIPESELQSLTPTPVDNGEWPDLVPNDGIWSNFTQTNEFLSPESYEIMRRVIRMIELAEDLNPLEFYGIPAASTSPFSELPYYTTAEENKDNKIQDWVDKFLKDYRRDPLDPNSDFWSIYIPRPPLKPKIAVPENFNATLLVQPAGEPGAEGENGAANPNGEEGGAPRAGGPRAGGNRGAGGQPRIIGGNPVGAARQVSGNQNAATTSYY